MARGKMRTSDRATPFQEQFAVVNDFKMQMTLAAVADKYNEKTRQLIKKTYDDPILLNLYKETRDTATNYQGTSRREILRIPNGAVYDFLDTVLGDLYGPDWMQNNKALRHELVLPWYVIPFNKL